MLVKPCVWPSTRYMAVPRMTASTQHGHDEDRQLAAAVRQRHHQHVGLADVVRQLQHAKHPQDSQHADHLEVLTAGQEQVR